MRIMILGADGYIGFPVACHFVQQGHSVLMVDDLSKRRLLNDYQSRPLFMSDGIERRLNNLTEWLGIHSDVEFLNFDVTKYDILFESVMDFEPDTIIHFAEQPSGPYSMLGQSQSHYTLVNNLVTTNNIAWAVMDSGLQTHIIKLGTMGEYGNPDRRIPEGYNGMVNSVTAKGLRPRLFPREAGSMYHTSKILDTDLLKFYCNSHGLRVTDLMQGPVYGLMMGETTEEYGLQTHFYYDDLFGTVVNRFIVQAMLELPLSIYGTGRQKKGFISLQDAIQCIDVATETPAAEGELRVFNQITEVLSVQDIASLTLETANIMGYINYGAENLPNPRGNEPGTDTEGYVYNVDHSGLQSIGLKPANLLTVSYMREMMRLLKPEINKVNKLALSPRFKY